jgi:hypothetical protein
MGPVSAVCKRNGAWQRVKGSCRAGESLTQCAVGRQTPY